MEDIIKLSFGLGFVSFFGIGFLTVIWFFLDNSRKEKLRTITETFLQSLLGRRISFFFFIFLGLVVSLASASAFVAITLFLFTEDELAELDSLVIYLINIFRPEALTPFFETATLLGNASVVIGVLLVSILIGLLRRH